MGTRYQGSPDEVRALEAFIKLSRGTQSMLARLKPHVTRHGITPTQFGILETILHVGPLNQRELRRKLLLSKGNISVVVNHLVEHKLVKRVRDEADRRRTVIHLTTEGRQLIVKIFPQVAAAVTTELSTLSASEQETLGRLMKKLGRAEPT